MNHEIVRLKKAFMFEGLPDDVLLALAQKITHQKLAAESILFHRGDAGDALYIIDEGEVKIVRENEQGGEVVLNRCGWKLSDGLQRLLMSVVLNAPPFIPVMD